MKTHKCGYTYYIAICIHIYVLLFSKGNNIRIKQKLTKNYYLEEREQGGGDEMGVIPPCPGFIILTLESLMCFR